MSVACKAHQIISFKWVHYYFVNYTSIKFKGKKLSNKYQLDHLDTLRLCVYTKIGVLWKKKKTSYIFYVHGQTVTISLENRKYIANL